MLRYGAVLGKRATHTLLVHVDSLLILMSDETYDETNEVWPYFLLTVVGVTLVPTTFSVLRTLLKGSDSASGRKEHQQFRARQRTRTLLASSLAWYVFAGWAVVAMCIAYIMRTEHVEDAGANLWDPYVILNIARDASAKEIRATYRKLSLQYHPDKLRDIAEEEKEKLYDVYVNIAKAYQALTDDVTKENYDLYGHPDGPQPVSHGIALPSFLFSSSASYGVLGLYVLVFGLGVPYLVSKWWSKTLARTRKGLLQETAAQFVELFVKEQPHFITTSRILEEVLKSADIDAAIGKKSNSEEVKRRVGLLNSYLDRSGTNSVEELLIATETARLIIGMHDIAVEFKNAVLCQRLLTVHRQILQAVSFAQIGTSVEHQQSGSNGKYMKLHLLSAVFEVSGEKIVTPNSKVFLRVQFLVLPISAEVPELSDKQKEEAALEFDEFCSHKAAATWNETQPLLPSAVAPQYPLEVPTRWYAYLFGPDNKLVEKPYEVSRIDLSNLSLSEQELKDGSNVKISTLVMPLTNPTPMEPVEVPLKFKLSSTCYFVCVLHAETVMRVSAAAAPPSKESVPQLEQDFESEDESSEEEEEGLSDVDTSTEEEDNNQDEDE